MAVSGWKGTKQTAALCAFTRVIEPDDTNFEGRPKAGTTAFPLATHTLSEGRRGQGYGGVSGMDAATKPPWTGSRRPP